MQSSVLSMLCCPVMVLRGRLLWCFGFKAASAQKLVASSCLRTLSTSSNMEKVLKQELRTTKLESLGRAGGGCISDGCSYDTDHGRVFVKVNSRSEVLLLQDHTLVIIYCMPEKTRLSELVAACLSCYQFIGWHFHSPCAGETYVCRRKGELGGHFKHRNSASS